MASNLSSIYNGLVTFISDRLTTYKQLPDAYDVDLNDNLRLKKGFAVGIGAGTNTERQFGCPQLSLERLFTVSFTNLYAAKRADASARGVIEKALMEDAFDIWKALETTTTLNGVQTVIKYVDDSGIVLLGEANSQYINVTSVISAEYFE